MGLLDDKIAIVTGAASGIGRAGAQLMAEAGASVSLPVGLVVDGAKVTTDVKALEKQLEEALGLRVDIAARGDERTQLTLFCDDYEQLDDVVARLSRAPRG